MRKINFAIFDMDGLLFDTERPSFLAMKKTAEKAGFKFSIDTYKKLIGVSKPTSNQILHDLYGEEFFKKNVLDHFQEEFNKIIAEEGIVIKKGALELLEVLEEKGFKKCIASSSNREVIENYLSITGLENRFDFYLSGREVKKGKPHPDIFLEACKRGGVDPEKALVLEDSFHGFRAAIRANIRCIIVPDLVELNDEMKQGAYRICSDLAEVAQLIRTESL